MQPAWLPSPQSPDTRARARACTGLCVGLKRRSKVPHLVQDLLGKLARCQKVGGHVRIQRLPGQSVESQGWRCWKYMLWVGVGKIRQQATVLDSQRVPRSLQNYQEQGYLEDCAKSCVEVCEVFMIFNQSPLPPNDGSGKLPFALQKGGLSTSMFVERVDCTNQG